MKTVYITSRWRTPSWPENVRRTGYQDCITWSGSIVFSSIRFFFKAVVFTIWMSGVAPARDKKLPFHQPPFTKRMNFPMEKEKCESVDS